MTSQPGRHSLPMLLPGIALVLVMFTVSPVRAQTPSITLYQPAGVQRDTLAINYLISDTDTSQINLLAEYSTNSGASWLPAAVIGDTTLIPKGSYTGFLLWGSSTNLPEEVRSDVWFRITPYDNSWGTPDIALIDIDNKPPGWITAIGTSGDTTITFWFDEPVQDATAINTSNIALSGGLTTGLITAIKWSVGSSMSYPRRGCASAVIAGKLYVVGGEDTTTLQVYDPATDTWETKASLSETRDGAVAVEINGKLYVASGEMYDFSDVEIYDPATNSWSTGPQHNTARWAAAGAINGKLYMAGGYGWGTIDDDLGCYNPITNNWTYLATMPTARWGASSGVISGRLYVAGGEHDGTYLTALEVYDPETDIWTAKADMPAAMGYASSGVINGRLYVAGGWNGTDFSDDLYVYNPATDTWSIESTIPSLRYETSAGAINDRLYIAGGYYGGYVSHVDIYDPRMDYELTLTSGQTLPGALTSVTVTASNITDYHGNTITASLDSSFFPASTQVPSVAVYQPTGVQSGNIEVPYAISDADSNLVGLLAEYSTNSGSSWLPAAVTGDTSRITPAYYNSSIFWQSGTDLANQVLEGVWFRITPDDTVGIGISDTTFIDIDNQAPQWIAAEGTSRDTTLSFWFEEPVTDSTATNLSNISLSGGLTIDSIAVTDVWVPADLMSAARRNAMPGVIDGKLYMAGGIGVLGTTFEVYDPATDSWTSRASMPTARYGGISGVIDGKLYVVGGYSSVVLNTLEVYNPVTNSWSSGASMPTARRYASCGVINGKLYVVGGNNGSNLNTLEMYDPATDSWSTGASMPTARQYAAAAVIGSKLYVAGGQNPVILGDLEVYDSETDSWTTRTSVPTARFGAIAGVLDGKLYVAGGRSLSTLDILDVYEPDTDNWTSRTSMPTARYHSMAGIIDGKLYVAGGYDTSNLSTFEVYDPQDHFKAVLTNGQTLPGSISSVLVTASNISDYRGNTISGSIDSSFTPASSEPPSVAVYQPTGVQSANITVSYVISDADSNLVSLLAEYSTNSGSSWQAASVSSDTSDIAWADYDSSLIWQSSSDLADQKLNGVWFRVTPHDTLGWGTADTAFIDIDNQPPQAVDASGNAGNNQIQFHFNETTLESTVVNLSNIALSGGLTIDTLWSIPDCLTGSVMAGAVMNASSILYQGKVYVVNGSWGNQLWRYNPRNDGWESLAAPIYTRTAPAFGEIKGKLVVATPTNSIYPEIYDPETNSWTTGALLGVSQPGAGSYQAYAVFDGKLYMAGGSDGTGGPLSALRAYDPEADTWSSLTPMPAGRSRTAFGVIDGKLYIAGGWSGDNAYEVDLQVYDPVSDTWSYGAPMPEGRANAISAVVQGKLYVIGGYNGTEYLDSALIYDPASDTWETSLKTWLAEPKTSAPAEIIDGRIYTFGGWTQPSNPTDQLDIIDPFAAYLAQLTDEQVLPMTQVTLTASNIADYLGNIIATPLDTTFTPALVDTVRPTIAIYQPTGTQAGDVTLPFVLSDPDDSEIGILAEYSTNSGSSWQAASVGSDTSDIAAADYDSSLVWQTATDLASQEMDHIWFRITPHDPYGWGPADTTYIDIDNQAPQWIAAEGTSGDTTLTFWFNEIIAESTATNISNLSLTGGLTIDSISGTNADTWATRTSMPTGRHSSATGVVDGNLYVVGGITTVAVDVLEEYDSVTGNWATKTSMPTVRRSMAAGVIDGKLYVVGGGSGPATDVLEVYDPSTDSWSTKTPLPVARSMAAAGVIDGKFYVTGGATNSATVGALEVYDPSTDSWTTRTSMPTARIEAASGVIDGKLYIVGGDYEGTELATLEVYDPSTDSWTTKTSMPAARKYVVAGVIAGKLYVTGGSTSEEDQKTLEVYDPSTDSWTVKTDMPTARSWASAEVIDNKFYVVGGGGEETALEVYTALPDTFSATLGNGQTLPGSLTSVTVTASNIGDYHGNTITAPLDSSFFPASSQVPAVAIYQPTGVQSGNTEVLYVITDVDSNLVSLLAEYSTNGGGSWQAASVTGDTSYITAAGYDSSLIWQSGSDLANEDLSSVWFRITPHDTLGWGTADTTYIDIDNLAPLWVSAEGTAGDSTFTFQFDELVADSAATNTSNFAISGGLSISSIAISGRWDSETSMPTARFTPASAVINGKLYVVGGELTSGVGSSALEVYDPASDSWESLASMPLSKQSMTPGVIDGKLYVVGGERSGFNYIRELEVYDPLTDTWATRSMMAVARKHAAGGVIDGKLYIAGGWTTTSVGALEVYDPSTDTWETKTAMPTPRAQAHTGIINGKLYVAGGYTGVGSWTDVLEVYDPTTDSWSTQASMPMARRGGSFTTIGYKLYVIGGDDAGGYLTTIEVYDSLTDSWTTLSSIPTGRDAGFGLIDGSFYIAGGYHGSVLNTLRAYSPHYRAVLNGEQRLPNASLNLTATSITDYQGNTIGSLETTFTPAFMDLIRPTITVYQPSGIQTGDVTIPFVITDPEDSPVGLLAEYSTNSGSSWQAASVGSDTSDIAAADYDSSLVWQSGSDLADQEMSSVWFRITPHDTLGWGTADTTYIDIDNLAPQWVAAEGVAGDTTFIFQFSEPVVADSASNPANFGLSGGLSIGSIQVGNAWSSGLSMPEAVYYGASGVIGGKLYSAGGQDNNTLYIYDPEADSWTAGASMSAPRGYSAAGVIDGKLHVTGGMSSSEGYVRKNTLEIYNPISNSWSFGSPMPTVRINHAIGVIEGRLYVIGGEDSGTTGALIVYDPATDTWSGRTSMPTPRTGPMAAVIDDKLYVAGGWTGTAVNVLEIYDPGTDSWTMGAPMPTARSLGLAIPIGGRMYVAGGHLASTDPSNAVEVYDPATDSWTSPGVLPTARREMAGGEIKGRLYLAGGSGSGGASNVVEVLNPQANFVASLIAGQSLPTGSITLTAVNIPDYTGNIASSLDSSFVSYDPTRPGVALYQPTGVQAGDVTVSYVIADPEGSPVGLLAEYSTNQGGTWQAASVSGDTSGIASVDYDSSLVWQSGNDLADQELSSVWFRVTPHDTLGWGTADVTFIDIDNQAPQWIEVEGTSGDSSFTFWFNELAADTSATNVGNFALTSGLTIGSISGSDDDSWVTKDPMPTPRHEASAGVINGILYVAGGEGGATALEAYNPATGNWTVKTPMPTGRSTASTGVIDDKLYVAGGRLGGPTAVLEVYDPSTNSWTTKVAMPTARESAEAGVNGGKLYVVGGSSDGSTAVSTLEIYDPSTNSWTTGAPMPTARVDAAVGVIDGKLYVAGGGNSGGELAALEVYDPAADSWSSATPMATARRMAGAGVIDGKLYVAGGQISGGALNTVEVYDPSTNSWTTRSYMPAALTWLASGVINGKLYLSPGLGGETLSIYTAIPTYYELMLTSGQVLPDSSTSVTLTASNISDIYGNTIATTLDTTFKPYFYDPTRPEISISGPSARGSGEITIDYLISDVENSSVGLLAEYSTNAGGTWLPASVSSDTSGIPGSAYNGSLIWQSGNDLANQELTGVWFRITPHDAGGWGTADVILVDLDNLAPQWIEASGTAGDTALAFWFDQPVDDATATDPANIALTAGLTVDQISAQRWTVGETMPYPRRGATSVVIDDQLYVIGGDYSTTLQVYDPAADSWTTRASLSNDRKGAAAEVIGGKIYVFGGERYDWAWVEIYDPSADSWTVAAQEANARWAASGVIDGKMYFAGGVGTFIAADTWFRRYDPLTDTWTSLAGLPTPRWGSVGEVLGGKLFVVGGTTDAGSYVSVVEVYDPATSSWSTKSPLPSALGFAASGVIGGKLYVAGGYDGVNFSDALYVYDPATDIWTTESTLPGSRYEATIGVINDRLYLAGGFYGDYVPWIGVYDLRGTYKAILSTGQTLPSTDVTITASNIADHLGNATAAPLDTTFHPYDPTRPGVALYQPTGVQAGDVTVSYVIADPEGSPVGLLVEYSTDVGSTWQAASVNGDTIGIVAADYESSLVWQSGTDLADQDLTS
ncbi:Kelch repeat-containing protein, partial [Gemmatimonadota bacterium]